ncbi:MAG: hypothetical protein OEX97_00400 [Acidimicrobiia bacterium]|nr:hypothetical protein [Acidimicrobiia bacterium]
MSDAITCPACRAANPAGSEWCGQCFAGFGTTSSPALPADPPVALSTQPEAGPVVLSGPPERSRGPSGPPAPPIRSDGGRPAVAMPPPGSPEGDSTEGWTCASCGTGNPVSLDVCRACDTSIYETFGAADEEGPEVEPSRAAIWGIIPGVGHFKVGQTVLGLAVAGLVFSALLFGVLMIGGNRRPVGFVLLAICVLAWAISVYDVTRFAAHNEDAVLLRPRVVTSVMGLVFAVVIVAAVSITGEVPTP